MDQYQGVGYPVGLSVEDLAEFLLLIDLVIFIFLNFSIQVIFQSYEWQ